MSWSASLDVAPVDGPPYTPTEYKNRAGILEAFDENVAEAKAALTSVSGETLHEEWSLLAGGQTIFTIPKVPCLRTWVVNRRG